MGGQGLYRWLYTVMGALGRDSLGVVFKDLVRGSWREPGRKVKEVGARRC